MNRTKYILTARSSTESSSGQTSSISFKSTDYEHCLEIRYTVHYPFICDWLPEDSQNGFLCVMSLCEHQGNHVPCIVWATGQLCVLYCVSIRAVMFHVCVSIRAAVCHIYDAPYMHQGSWSTNHGLLLKRKFSVLTSRLLGSWKHELNIIPPSRMLRSREHIKYG